MFIVPIVFLANNEPEFRNYLIKFNPELLVFYSYCCESLTEFDKKNILNNLFKKYPYRIRHITSSFFNNPNKAFIFFTKGLDIKYIIRKIKQTERDDFWREYFLIKLLFYSDIGKLDKKVRGKVNAMLFSYIYYGNNRDFASTAIEILLMQKQLQINQKLTKYLTEKTSKISEYTINTFFDYLYPKFISFIEAIDLLDKYIKEMEEDISVFYLKVILKNLIQQGSDIHGLKTALDTIHFDFSKESSLSLYIILLIAYIDYGGNDESVAEYLFKLQEYNVLRYGTIYSPYKSDDELKELKAKITSTATISLVEKIIDKYILLDEKNIWGWLEYDYLFKKDENLFKMLLEKSNTPSLPENKVSQLFSYCLRNLQQISPNNYKEIVKPYLNSKYKRQIWKNFLNPETPKWKFKQDKKDNEQKIKKEKELNFLLEHIDDIKKASEKYQYILIRLSLENGMNESSDISRIEDMWGKNVADAYKQGIQKYWQISKVDFNQYLNEVIGTNQILNQTIASLTGLHIFFKENIDANITEEQARRVIYWGIQELNSIPEWAVRVIQKHSMVAKDIILPVIDKIIEINKDSLILDKLSRIDSNVLSIFYEDLWVRLQNNPTSEVIQNILKVLIRMHLSNTQKEALVSYIDSKIDDIKNKDVIKWFELLYVVSLDEFTKKIFEFNTKYYHMRDEMKDFFEQLFGKLNHRQIYENKNVTKDVYKLLDLLPLLFKYINPQDDIIHKSGVAFTPSIRDNAQDFRNDVLNFINIRNFTIHDRKYLLDLSSRIKSKYPCDSINYVADELLMKDSVNLSENDVIKIENLDYLPPKNSDDLFRIVCDKINEVKMDIETSDYSIKKLYQDLATTDNAVKIKKEEHFQKYMLMELRRLSRNLYSLVREPEVANNNKPDLQVWDKNWCVNIECKIADNWSGEKILETVELQLVKKYLQYPKYQYGILLLARISETLWKLDTEKKSFFDLIESIQKHSDLIKNKYSHIKEIKILGIDYSLPL
ncbi:MAG: hypothetical protein AB7E39_03090 [Endomicrobiaceae bacterium]